MEYVKKLINKLEGQSCKGVEAMARTARVCSSINLYHIIIRGINKQDIFIDDQDKNKFMKALAETKEKFNFKLYAYVIMPNHVHLVIKDDNAEISKIMHRIQVCYSEYLNSKYNRIGHVFQGRFTSKNIETEEYLKYVIRYIHLNPDKAGIGKYDKYKWSSYNFYNKPKDTINLIDTSDILILFSEEKQEAIDLFEKFHKEKSKYQYNEEYSEFEIQCKLDDDIVIKIIMDNIGLNTIYDIQKLNYKYRNEVLKKLINIKGTTVKQISRITGISTKIIEKVKKLY